MAIIKKGDTVYNRLKAFFDEKGVPEYIWYSIMQAESGGDTAAIGDGGTSFGLYQIHHGSTPFTSTERQKLLSDPIYNAQRAYGLWTARGGSPDDFAAQHATEGSGEYAAYFWIYAQRPRAWTDYNQNGQFNEAMKKVADIAEGGGAQAGSTQPSASEQQPTIEENDVYNWIAVGLGIVLVIVVVVMITRGGAGNAISSSEV